MNRLLAVQSRGLSEIGQFVHSLGRFWCLVGFHTFGHDTGGKQYLAIQNTSRPSRARTAVVDSTNAYRPTSSESNRRSDDILPPVWRRRVSEPPARSSSIGQRYDAWVIHATQVPSLQQLPSASSVTTTSTSECVASAGACAISRFGGSCARWNIGSERELDPAATIV